MIAARISPESLTVVAVFVGAGPPPDLGPGAEWVQVARYPELGTGLEDLDLIGCDNRSAPQAIRIIKDSTKCDNLSAPAATIDPHLERCAGEITHT